MIRRTLFLALCLNTILYTQNTAHASLMYPSAQRAIAQFLSLPFHEETGLVPKKTPPPSEPTPPPPEPSRPQAVVEPGARPRETVQIQAQGMFERIKNVTHQLGLDLEPQTLKFEQPFGHTFVGRSVRPPINDERFVVSRVSPTPPPGASEDRAEGASTPRDTPQDDRVPTGHPPSRGGGATESTEQLTSQRGVVSRWEQEGALRQVYRLSLPPSGFPNHPPIQTLYSSWQQKTSQRPYHALKQWDSFLGLNIKLNRSSAEQSDMEHRKMLVLFEMISPYMSCQRFRVLESSARQRRTVSQYTRRTSISASRRPVVRPDRASVFEQRPISGQLKAFALYQGIDEARLLKRLKKKETRGLDEIQWPFVRALMNMSEGFKAIALRYKAIASTLEKIFDQQRRGLFTPLPVETHDNIRRYLMQLDQQRELIRFMPLDEQAQLRKDQAQRLEEVADPKILLQRVMELSLFSRYVQADKKLEYLVYLAGLVNHTTQDITTLLSLGYREQDQQDIHPEYRSFQEAQSAATSLTEQVRKTREEAVAQAWAQLKDQEIWKKCGNINKDFILYLQSFIDRFDLEAKDIAQLSQLAAQLRLRAEETIPSVSQTSREEPLPLCGNQETVSHFYPDCPHGVSMRLWRQLCGGWPTGNSCAVQPYAVVFSTRERGTDFDYYHIGLGVQLNLDPKMAEPDHLRVPVLLSTCDVGASALCQYTGEQAWRKAALNPAVLECLQLMENWSPLATVGETKRTTSTGLTVEGQVTQSGMQPGGSEGVSFSLEHATERTTKDMSILPHVNRASPWWRFHYNNLGSRADRGNDCARSTATPFIQWVWKIRRDAAEQLLYTQVPAQAGVHPSTSGYYFNFDFWVRAGLRAVFTIPLFEKSLKSSETVMTIMPGLAGGNVLSIPVPPRLPLGRVTTKVMALRTTNGSNGSGESKGKA